MASQPTVPLQPAISAMVAAAITALALAGGGFPPASLGVATALVWLLLAGLLLGGRIGLGALRPPLLIVLCLLSLLAAWTALSLTWAADNGAAFADLVLALLYLGIVALVGLAARAGSAPSWLAGIGLGGSLVAAIALGSRLLDLGGDAELAQALPLAAERLSYPLGYWNALGYLMAMTLPALVWLAAAGPRRLVPAALAGTVPVIGALFLTSSRGALLGAALALALTAWFSFDRRRLFVVAAVALPAWAAVVVVAAIVRDELDPGAGLGTGGLVAAAVMVAAMVAVAVTVWAIDGGGVARRSRGRRAPRAGSRSRLVTPAAIAAVVAIVTALVVVIGPSAFVGEFRAEQSAAEQGSTSALVSDSGRSSFWATALDAFSEDPLRGIGAGGYGTYWNVHGELDVPTRNAHSAPLELLAELGILAGLVLAGVAAVVIASAVRCLRGRDRRRRGLVVAVIAILIPGALALAIDWTWEVPAAMAPAMIAVALLCGDGLRHAGSARGSVLVDPKIAGYEPLDAPASPPPPIIGAALGGFALAAVWAGAVLALASVQLGISDSRLAAGDLQGAAEASRAAATIEPWSPEASLRLAEIEQAAGNLVAARLRAEEAARLAPEDVRPWVLLSQIHFALGNKSASDAYVRRAVILGPRVLPRALLEAG